MAKTEPELTPERGRKKREPGLAGLVLLSNLPLLIALVAWLLWRYG
ncbi:hypothetical protein [Leeia sp.]